MEHDEIELDILIRLIHGEPVRASVKVASGDRFALGSEIGKALETGSIAIELDGRLLVIPRQNIQSIEFSPCPSNLPPSVIRGARSRPEPVSGS